MLLSTQAADLSWQQQIVYQIMPDRYIRANSKQGADIDLENPSAWHSGDLAGVQQGLPQLKTLGFTALWLTPLYLNTSLPAQAGYHGYWPQDFRQIDPHFGNWSSWDALRQQSQTLGIRLILDQVINHFGYQANAVLEHPEWFHSAQDCALANPSLALSRCALFGLPDLNQNNPEVANMLLANNQFWREKGVNTFRYDAVRHVEPAFLQKLLADNQKHQTFSLAEVLSYRPEDIASYQKMGFDSLFDFPLQDAIASAIMGVQSQIGRPSNLQAVRQVLAEDHLYPKPNNLAIFLDNHDLPRLVSRNPLIPRAQQLKRMQYAIRALMSLRGVPVLYYGTEIGLAGGADPDNRRDMPSIEQRTPQEAQLMQVTQQAIAVRKQYPALQNGTLKLLDLPENVQEQVLIYERSNPEQQLLVVWHQQSSRHTYSFRLDLATQPQKVLRDVYGQDCKLSFKNEFFHISVPEYTVCIFKLP